uniref:Uncharacterized protein n=1 Tax=Rhizophora mucronata TaxID=61149 RepID=A0A2P2PYH6_RHIMU
MQYFLCFVMLFCWHLNPSSFN